MKIGWVLLSVSLLSAGSVIFFGSAQEGAPANSEVEMKNKAILGAFWFFNKKERGGTGSKSTKNVKVEPAVTAATPNAAEKYKEESAERTKILTQEQEKTRKSLQERWYELKEQIQSTWTLSKEKLNEWGLKIQSWWENFKMHAAAEIKNISKEAHG